MVINNGLIFVFGNITTPSGNSIICTLPICLSNNNYIITTGLYDANSPHDGYTAIASWDYRTINSFSVEASYSGRLYTALISYIIVGS